MADIAAEIEQRGFVRVPLGIDADLIRSLARRVYERVGASEDDPSTWSSLPAASRGFVPIWNDEILWRVRAQPGLTSVFAELFGTDELWVSVDRCHFKPPVRFHPELGMQHFLHWDSDPTDPLFAPYQASISLTDTPYDQGAFTCSPDMFAAVRDGDSSAARAASDNGFIEAISVGCAAGDLLVWDHRLLHGNSANTGESPRLAMYVTMKPAGDVEERRRRTAFWASGEWPGGPSRYPGFSTPDVASPNIDDFWRPVLGLDMPGPRKR